MKDSRIRNLISHGIDEPRNARMARSMPKPRRRLGHWLERLARVCGTHGAGYVMPQKAW